MHVLTECSIIKLHLCYVFDDIYIYIYIGGLLLTEVMGKEKYF